MKRCSLAFPLKTRSLSFACRLPPAAATEALTVAVRTIAGECERWPSAGRSVPSLRWRPDKLSRVPAPFRPAVFSRCPPRPLLSRLFFLAVSSVSLSHSPLCSSQTHRSPITSLPPSFPSPHSSPAVPPHPIRISNSGEVS